MPNIMPLPPALFMSFLLMNCPRPMKITMGKIHESSMVVSGDISSTISWENFAPDSSSRSTRPGSNITPVL